MLHVVFCVCVFVQKHYPYTHIQSARNSYVVSFSTIKYHDVGFQYVFFLVRICIELSVEFSFIFRVKIENTKHIHIYTHRTSHPIHPLPIYVRYTVMITMQSVKKEHDKLASLKMVLHTVHSTVKYGGQIRRQCEIHA